MPRNLLFCSFASFLVFLVSVADTAIVKHKGIKTLLASGFGAFPIKEKPAFVKGPRGLPKNSPGFTRSYIIELSKILIL